MREARSKLLTQTSTLMLRITTWILFTKRLKIITNNLFKAFVFKYINLFMNKIQVVILNIKVDVWVSNLDLASLIALEIYCRQPIYKLHIRVYYPFWSYLHIQIHLCYRWQIYYFQYWTRYLYKQFSKFNYNKSTKNLDINYISLCLS